VYTEMMDIPVPGFWKYWRQKLALLKSESHAIMDKNPEAASVIQVHNVLNDIEIGFLRVLRFPLPIIPPISPSSQSPRVGTIGLLVAAVPSGPNWTPPPTKPIKKKVLNDIEILAGCTPVKVGESSEWTSIVNSVEETEQTFAKLQMGSCFLALSSACTR
jgi:hypothetical protein